MGKVCRGDGRKAADEFHFEVGEFMYLGDMLNDTGEVEQTVTIFCLNT